MGTLVLVGIFIIVMFAMAMGAAEIFLKHQREMASLRRNGTDNRVAALETKIDELTQLVYQQTIALDTTHRPAAVEREYQKVGL